MSAAVKWNLLSEAEYLRGELLSEVKHEYMGGVLYAMAGAGNAHNRVATNITIALGGRLRGRPCQPFNSDTKIRLRLPTQTRYYYPDVSVVCRSNPSTDSFQDEPVVVVEVLSPSTRRLDNGEKREAYLSLPSVRVYLMVETTHPRVEVYRLTEQGFVEEHYQGLEAVILLPEIDAALPLSEIYERAEFLPEG